MRLPDWQSEVRAVSLSDAAFFVMSYVQYIIIVCMNKLMYVWC